jgi:hypothetical protein
MTGWGIEQGTVTRLVFSTGIGFQVFPEPGQAAVRSETAQVLQAEGGLDPVPARDLLRDWDEVESLIGEALTGFEAEEAVDPLVFRQEVGGILAHRDVAEAVGATGKGVGIEEVAEGAGVRFVEALIGVDRDDPFGVEGLGGGEEAIAVRGIVPALIVIPPGIAEQDLDERFLGEEVGGGIGAAVVEGDDGIAALADGLEVAGQIGGGVPGRQETDEQRAFLRLLRGLWRFQGGLLVFWHYLTGWQRV